MPRHTPVLLALLLAACNGTSEPTDPVLDTATETPAAATTTPVAAATPIAYDCLPAQRLAVSYDNTGATPEATLTLDGKVYHLLQVSSASGARYSTDDGRAAGKTLIWWSKGEDGTLYEGTVGRDAGGGETKLAECSPSAAAG